MAADIVSPHNPSGKSRYFIQHALERCGVRCKLRTGEHTACSQQMHMGIVESGADKLSVQIDKFCIGIHLMCLCRCSDIDKQTVFNGKAFGEIAVASIHAGMFITDDHIITPSLWILIFLSIRHLNPECNPSLP